MSILNDISARYGNLARPFLFDGEDSLTFEEVYEVDASAISEIGPKDVVALIGDFGSFSIATLLRLIDRGAIVVPLSPETVLQHEYFFDHAEVTVVIEGKNLSRLPRKKKHHHLIRSLQEAGRPGLIVFSSGTVGKPKAILHDFTKVVRKFQTPRPSLRTLQFLMFDHLGGVNTLLHTLFNRGEIVVPSDRTPSAVMEDINMHSVELLPTTPTFLRMALIGGLFDDLDYPSLKLITYGTERMDQPTLDELCRLLPNVDIRQTYGLSELGVFQVRSKARNSLWMEIGGEGVTTRVNDGNLLIRSENRMLGYLNAPPPFDDDWYDTGDLVEAEGKYVRITGRQDDVINIGGVKVLPEEIERVALEHKQVLRAKATGVHNPITNQHIEVTCELVEGANLTRKDMKRYFAEKLPVSIRPQRIRLGKVSYSHRFKRN